MPRQKEPIDLLQAKGRKHLTKAEIAQRQATEIKADDDKVCAPSFLTKKEREKFDFLAQELKNLRIMSNLDCDILGRYVRAESEYIKVSKQLKKITFTPDLSSDVPPEEQLQAMYEQYALLAKTININVKICNDCGAQLGLSIASRLKLVAPKPPEEKRQNKFLADRQA